MCLSFRVKDGSLIPPKHVCIRTGGCRCRSRCEEGWATMKLSWDRDELIPETPPRRQCFEPPCFLACSGTPSGSCPQSLKMVCYHSIPSDAAGFRASERAAGVQGSPQPALPPALPREAGSLVPTIREPLQGVCIDFASSQGAVPPRLRLSLPSPCPPHRHYKEKTTESFAVPSGFKPGQSLGPS